MSRTEKHVITLNANEGAVVFREDHTFDLMLKREYTDQWVMHMLALVKTLLKSPVLMESVENHLVKTGVLVMECKAERGSN